MISINDRDVLFFANDSRDIQLGDSLYFNSAQAQNNALDNDNDRLKITA
jgi:hypothetical protein